MEIQGTWWDFMSKPDMTAHERVLVQAIATLSTRDGFTHMTPEEVFESQRALAFEPPILPPPYPMPE